MRVMLLLKPPEMMVDAPGALICCALTGIEAEAFDDIKNTGREALDRAGMVMSSRVSG